MGFCFFGLEFITKRIILHQSYPSQNEGLSPSCIALSFYGLAHFHGTVFGLFVAVTVFTAVRVAQWLERRA
jgi:hypothetical protein